MHAPSPDMGWERLFWLVFRRSSNAIMLVDDERRIVEVNEPAVALVARSRAELIGKSIVDVIDPSERAESARQWQAFLHSGEYMGARDLLRADGSAVAIDFAARLADVDGRRLAIYVMLVKDGQAPGGSWPAPRAPRSSTRPLTPREREVVTLIAMGRETNQIAQELHVSSETVRTHVRNAMAKLGAHTRAQLVAIALCTDSAIHLPQEGERAAAE
jgi:PAS domain S-box-containing protein